MKKLNLRTLSALLAAVTVAAVFAGCGSIRPIKSKDEDMRVVMTVSGAEVYYDELRYITLNARRDFEAKYGADCFSHPEKGDEYRRELEEFVQTALKKNAVIMSYAGELGIDTDSKKIKSTVQKTVDGMAEEAGGKKEYTAQLEANFMTDRLLRYNLRCAEVYNLLQMKLVENKIIDGSDEAARASIEGDGFIRTLHVYVQNDGDENIEDNQKKAQRALDELRAGEKLTSVIGRYSEDFYMTTTDGYYFTYGEYDEAYEAAAMALDIGEYSEVVETATGFYVICRLEKDKTYIEKNFEALKERYLYAAANACLTERAASAEANMSDLMRGLDITQIS